MSPDVPYPDRIVMSQKERDVLKVLHGVLRGERSQAPAAIRLSSMVSAASFGGTHPGNRASDREKTRLLNYATGSDPMESCCPPTAGAF